MLVVASILAGCVPIVGVFFWLYKRRSSTNISEDFRASIKNLEDSIRKLRDVDFDKLFPKEAFDALKETKNKIQAEVESLRQNYAKINERIVDLTAKLQEKEKFYQKLKVPDPQKESLISKFREQYQAFEEKYIQIEKTSAGWIQYIENLDVPSEKQPFKGNLHDFLLNFGALIRNYLILGKELSEKIAGLQVQIEELEQEFSKLLDKQVT